ncbi:transposase [Labrys sp. 22185]|uniref:transposase n=1 Tax=Labrys sp. 22185 TaxID=3453888 RepID=UPI003F82C7F0
MAATVRATVHDPNGFKRGRDFAAWLGLRPRLLSSGGKEKLGSISKQGNRRLRTLLVVGASSIRRSGGGAAGLAHGVIGSKALQAGGGGAHQQGGADHLALLSKGGSTGSLSRSRHDHEISATQPTTEHGAQRVMIQDGHEPDIRYAA